MANDCKPYIEFAPADLITAEGMNEMQELICQDIHTKVDEGVASITQVDSANDAGKLGGKTAEELCKEWLEKALKAIPQRTGYMKVFKRFKPEDIAIIEHNLKACPLVDSYQLVPFDVVCAIDDDKARQRACFYLYHSSEKKIKNPDSASGDGNPAYIEIEEGDLPVQFKTPLAQVLDTFNVPYTDDSSLGDLETELWKAMFSDPNDDFDMNDYCHSPWFERCCREERTVASMKKKGDWDDLWLKMIPRKNENLRIISSLRDDTTDGNNNNDDVQQEPSDLYTVHFNMDTLGMSWRPPKDANGNFITSMEEQKLMVLLKV